MGQSRGSDRKKAGSTQSCGTCRAWAWVAVERGSTQVLIVGVVALCVGPQGSSNLKRRMPRSSKAKQHLVVWVGVGKLRSGPVPGQVL